jgi:hypothetical protein
MPPAVVIFSGPGRQTIAQGRNDRAKTARGDFFIFLDADCIIPEPDRFFTQALSQFRKYPNLVALTAYLRVFPAKETFGDKLVMALPTSACGSKTIYSTAASRLENFR